MWSLFGVCRYCKALKTTKNQVLRYSLYTKSQLFRRISMSTRCLINANKSSVVDLESVEEESDVWEQIEHDVADMATFNILKEKYLERVEEMKNDTTEKKKKFRHKKVRFVSKYDKDGENQLTHQGEKNVLAEMDIYIFLGEIVRAFDLFNYHRRHGHKFNIDGYNKMILGWARHRDWSHIDTLYKSLVHEGLKPNHQTYAGMLVACDSVKNVKKTKDVVEKLENEGVEVSELLTKSQLSKSDCQSVIKALTMLDDGYVEKFVKNNEHRGVDEYKITELEGRDVEALVKAQLDNELNGYLKIKSIDTTKTHKKQDKRRAKWYKEIVVQGKKDFIAELERKRVYKESSFFINTRLAIFTKLFTPEELANMVFDEILPILCSQPGGIEVSYLCRRLGHIMFARFCSKFKEEAGVVEKVEEIAMQYCARDEWLNDSIHPREAWQQINESLHFLASEDLLPTHWPTKLRTLLSGFLLDILKDVLKVDTSLFTRTKHTSVESCITHSCVKSLDGFRSVGVLKVHPLISRLYHSYLNQLGDIYFESNKLPMLIPPRPWMTCNSGAYMLLHTDLVRTIAGYYNLSELSKASRNGELSKIYDSLNYLGNCAWKVNTTILDIMIELFNGNGDMKLDIIGPIDTTVQKYEYNAEMTLKDKKSARRFQRKLHHELFALRMDLLYKLSVSNHFRDKIFWIPSNLDFRGRAYPIAPHCSHIGSDASRGLLLFARGKPLGERGLDWLKVHLVNVHGHLKKSSLEMRIKFADDNMEEIMDSADYPLTGKQWWKGASDPWQTLVACMEVTNAIRSPDPTQYVSHTPVHMDGSCNGLQHYAALGHDEYGARQVNLMPSEKPQDVYSEVAHLVERSRVKDAESGDDIALKLDGKVTRKVVKQTVMTVVYGVTFIGGRLQIEKQLRDLGVPSEILFKASVYIVKKVFESLQEMFTSARQIQDWLTVSASQIALSGNCVDWVTPLGLPIVQPYHKETTERFRTSLQNVSSIHKYDYTQLPDLTKQKGGFPPNFVHSLDSSHMMMTSLRCQEHEMTFASVHDSFWTHANEIDSLNRFCRAEFVNLHELPILENLKKHFDEKFAGLPLRKSSKKSPTVAYFSELPASGAFDLRQVIDSTYFFS